MSSHDLLIRHARAWAEQRKRPLDPELLETALELRSFHDDLPATAWPAGSVTDLMLRRWPSHGPEVADPEALADSLDTFVRFLRATGRMASGSEEPRALAKEARRAAPRMAAAVADAAHHGPTKTLLGFGREIGIDVERAEGPEQLQAALNQIMTAWNALPDDERRSRMPLTSMGTTPSGRGGVLFPQGGAGAPADLVRAAEQARQSPFVQACLRLTEWVGKGRQVTETGALRLAEARNAYTELELWRWSERDRALLVAESLGEGEGPTLGPDDFPWRSARDVLALERLWYPVEYTALVEVGQSVARATGDLPDSDHEWVDLAIDLVFGLYEGIADDGGAPSSAPALLLVLELAAGQSLSRERLRALWDEDPDNYYRTDADVSEEFRERAALLSGALLERSLHFFADAGLWEEQAGAYRPTDLGKVFAHLYAEEAALDYLDDPDD